VPSIYKKYRADVTDIARKFMRQTVREGLQMTFAMYTAEELYADKKEVARAGVQKFLTDSLGKDGFVVQQFTINEQRPPKQVMEAIGAKVAMTQEAQKAEAEVRKTQALAAQAKAQALGEADAAEARAAGLAKARKLEADAEAYYNQTVSRSLTPELVRYETAKRWNGVMPTYTGGPVPMIDLTK
jgi:regulator of protease activity HflC (stomatin/prohibitin superfamily)